MFQWSVIPAHNFFFFCIQLWEAVIEKSITKKDPPFILLCEGHYMEDHSLFKQRALSPMPSLTLQQQKSVGHDK